MSTCRNYCEFSCLNKVIYHTQPCISSPAHHIAMLAALVISVCLSAPLEPRLALPLGAKSHAVMKTSKLTECEGHTLFFAWALDIHFYPFRPKGFFTLWRFHLLFFVITALVIASFYFQTLCRLWPFLLSPIWYEGVNSHFLFTCYDNFNLYCQTITLFFNPYSLIHKPILR